MAVTIAAAFGGIAIPSGPARLIRSDYCLGEIAEKIYYW